MAKSVTVDFNANIARFTSSVDRMTNDLSKFQTNAARISKNIDKSFASLGGGLQAAFSGIAAAVSVRELGQMAETYSNIQSRLKLATRNSAEFAQAQENVRRISASTQSSLEETATLYTRISTALMDVGGTQKQVADTTQAMALALRISGATTAEANSAMLQFSQIISSGRTEMGEFNSVNEAAPRLIKALADGLGVPIGQLRALQKEGKLTRDVWVEALGSQLPKLLKEAETLPNTVSGAFTSLRNEVMLAVGEIDKLTGATSRVANAIGSITKGVEGWKNFISPNEQQAIIKRLEAIRFEMDAILAQRKLISNLGFDSSSFRSDALNKFNDEAQKLQRNLQKMQEDSDAAGRAASKAAEDAAALAKKRAKEIEDAAAAEKRRADAQKAAEAAAKALASQQKTFVDGLQKEADTLGMTSAQLKVYEASLLKITGARLDGVKANASRIEAFQAEQKVLEDMRESYAEAAESYLKFIGTVAKDNKSAAEKIERLKVELGLVDKSEAQQKRMLALYDLEVKVKERLKELDGLDTGDSTRRIQEEAILKAKASEEEAIRLEEQIQKQKTQVAEMQKVWDNFGFNLQRNLGDQLFQILDGNFKNIGASFASMIKRMVADALAANLAQALFGKDGGLLKMGLSLFSSVLGVAGGMTGGSGALKVTSGALTGFAAKGAYFDGNVAKFAKGGIVDSPTLFKFASGGSINNGLMGEAGPEAIMPLKRDSQGRLGVAAQGGGAITINDNRVINIDSRSDRASILQDVQKMNKQSNAELVDRLNRQGVI